VQLESGDRKSMAALAVGDRVLVDANTFSEVFMFSHRYEDVEATFVKLTTAAGELLITADHYLYVNDKLAVASTVKVGDMVVAFDGAKVQVTAVSSERASGLYNPQTMHGDIVVDGIKTSTYTAAVAPALAHAALWPVRLLYSLGYDIINGAFDQGSELIAALMPNGRKVY